MPTQPHSHATKFIEDISYPKQGGIRIPVRIRRSKKSQSSKRSLSSATIKRSFISLDSVASRIKPSAYTSVQPYGARLMPDDKEIDDNRDKFAAGFKAASGRALNKFRTAKAALIGAPLLSSIHWLPKHYTANRGLKPDLSGKVFSGAKFSLPVALVIAVFAVIVMAWPLSMPDLNTGGSSHKPGATARTAANTKSNPSSSSSSGNSASQSKAGSPTSTSSQGGGSASQTPAVPTGTASGNFVGGRGGGSPATSTPSTATPAPTTPAIPGVTQPYPVTVPPQTVNGPDGKPIIGTSGTTVTLN